MTKVLKATVYIADPNEYHTPEELIEELENGNDWLVIRAFVEAEADFEWHDDTAMNQPIDKSLIDASYDWKEIQNEL